ncbi:MAG: orotate phosphoribosyltransferase [Chloroflexota bacterium]|jgi:orotate phosphoribosyltransferase/uridine monophosphate synthetase|nr:phosphoribosyltransferase [Chloroflexota bacterium]NCA12821.1 phosphoribosyltransferase [Pseudomonadota bacterium]
MSASDVTNLWLAEALFRMGAVRFGDFTLGRSTVGSPIYIDPKVLLGEPRVLARVGELIKTEIDAGMARRGRRVQPFDMVAGVPFGGLHLATAYALLGNVPLIYAQPPTDMDHGPKIEGRYRSGATVLIIDDLMTTGGSILETQRALQDVSLVVHDAIVLVDRGQGGGDRLRATGVHVSSILNLTQMLNFYRANEMIGDDDYRRSIEYVQTHRASVD